MPWSVKRDSRCPASKPYGVVLESDGSLEGCHASRVGAREQQAALYANEATKGLGFVPAGLKAAFDPNQPRDREGKWTDRPGSSATIDSGWGDLADLPPEPPIKPAQPVREGYRHVADVAVPSENDPSLDNLPPAAYDSPGDYMDKFNPMLGTNYHGLSAFEETLATIDAARGKPNTMITIYRGGVPAGNGINSGDWVTPSRRYAEVIQALRGGKIIAASVPAHTVHWGGQDLNEFGYHGPTPQTRQVKK